MQVSSDSVEAFYKFRPGHAPDNANQWYKVPAVCSKYLRLKDGHIRSTTFQTFYSSIDDCLSNLSSEQVVDVIVNGTEQKLNVVWWSSFLRTCSSVFPALWCVAGSDRRVRCTLLKSHCPCASACLTQISRSRRKSLLSLYSEPPCQNRLKRPLLSHGGPIVYIKSKKAFVWQTANTEEDS